MNNKIFKALDFNGNTLAIIAVKDEDTAWVWATGSELPIHSMQEIDPNLAKCVVLAKATEHSIHEFADHLRRRSTEPNIYVLK